MSSSNIIDRVLDSGKTGQIHVADQYTAPETVQSEPSAKEENCQVLTADADEGATWLETCYHNVTAMVGAGVLGLPHAFASLGWGGGISVLLVSLVISWYTFGLLVYMHEGGPHKRFMRYGELCQFAWGHNRGRWALLSFQIPFLYGLAVTYTVTGGSNLGSFASLIHTHGANHSSDYLLSTTSWIIIFSAVEVFLSQLPDLSSLAWVSAMGALMSLLYSVGGSAIALNTAMPRDQVDYTPVIDLPGGNTTGNLLGIFSAITTIFFAFGGHNIAVEIQATLPFPPSTVKPMMKGVHGAFILTIICYFTMSISGFYAFGNVVAENVLQSVSPSPLGLLGACFFAVVLHVLSSYQVYSSVLFELIESSLTQYAARSYPAQPPPAPSDTLSTDGHYNVVGSSTAALHVAAHQSSTAFGAAAASGLDANNVSLLVHSGSVQTDPSSMDIVAGDGAVVVRSSSSSQGLTNRLRIRSVRQSLLNTSTVAHNVICSTNQLLDRTGNADMASSQSEKLLMTMDNGRPQVQQSSANWDTAAAHTSAQRGGSIVSMRSAALHRNNYENDKGYIAYPSNNRLLDQPAVQIQMHSLSLDAAGAIPGGHATNGYSNNIDDMSSGEKDHVAEKGNWFSYMLYCMGPTWRRVVVRLLYVCSTCFLAALIPFFGDLMGLVGALAVTPTTFVIPCLLWLTLKRPKAWTSSAWWLCWVTAIVASSLGVLGAIGAMYSIVQNAKNYELFGG